MEFTIAMRDVAPDTAGIERLLRAADPASLLDFDRAAAQLRLSTSLPAADLLALFRRAGWPLAPEQLARLPSQCCGGCGG